MFSPGIEGIIHHISGMKEKNYIIIPVYVGKIFDKIQLLFMILENEQIRIIRELPHLDKGRQ